MRIELTPEFRDKLIRELPPFPENRKVLEGGDGFWGRYVDWPLVFSPLVALSGSWHIRSVSSVRLAIMRSLSGAVTDHELLRIAVSPPVLPVAVESHALAASREKALPFTDDRRMLLAACAVEVERELQRIVWPARRARPRRSSSCAIETSAAPYCALYPR